METSDLRARALDIFAAALDVAHPHQLVNESLTLKGSTLSIRGLDGEQMDLDLGRSGRVVAVGAGKATAPMAQALEELLEERLEGGVISVKYGHGVPLERITLREAGHPIPDEAGVAATEEICGVLEGLDEGDIAFVVISGGGSALLDAYPDPITLQDAQKTFDILLASGAPIQEMNVVRKHISRVKGGRLAQLASPARIVALVLSDVIGDPLPSIASGPTVPDPSTFAQALEILDRYGVREKVPEGVRVHLENGSAGQVPETPKPGDPDWERCRTFLIGSNRRALEAASERASTLGMHPRILTSELQGEAAEAGRTMARMARQAVDHAEPVPPPCCLIAGGETVVTLTEEHGKGGRNQELAASASVGLVGLDGVVILSGGTDGTDGPTDAAGGIVDSGTVERAREAGIDVNRALERHDAYHYLEAAGDLVRTGPTMTNVMDMVLVLVAPGEVPDA